MGLAVQELRISAPRPQVSIAALPSIAQLWLAPRLPALRAALPALRPSIHALEEPPDFRREPFDLAIFLTRQAPAGSRAFKLCDDFIYPVCAPALARQLKTPADLAAQLLLWDTTWTGDWALWFEAAGVKGPSIESGSEFSLYSMRAAAHRQPADHAGQRDADRGPDAGKQPLAQRRAGKDGDEEAKRHDDRLSGAEPGDLRGHERGQCQNGAGGEVGP